MSSWAAISRPNANDEAPLLYLALSEDRGDFLHAENVWCTQLLRTLCTPVPREGPVIGFRLMNSQRTPCEKIALMMLRIDSVVRRECEITTLVQFGAACSRYGPQVLVQLPLLGLPLFNHFCHPLPLHIPAM
jgi:hypothetical protein